MARALPLPAYETTGQTGPSHEPCFTVEVRIQGFAPEAAQAGSKREAEKAAAQLMLDARLPGSSANSLLAEMTQGKPALKVSGRRSPAIAKCNCLSCSGPRMARTPSSWHVPRTTRIAGSCCSAV